MATSKHKLAVVSGLALAILATGAGRFSLAALGESQPKGVQVGEAAPSGQSAVARRPEPLRIRNAHGSSISALAFSPDGKALASGGHNNAVYLFDVATGKKLREFFGSGGIVLQVAFSPDGKILAVANWEGHKILLWDVAAGRELGRIRGRRVAAFSPDGKALVTVVGDGAIQFWDVAAGTELRRLSGHLQTDAVLFSADGKLLASSGADREKNSVTGTIRVWDVVSGKLLHEWSGINGGPNVIALCPSGKTLVQGGEYAPVRVLDIATGKRLRTFDHLPSMVHSAAVSPDGKLLVTASGYVEYRLQVWELATGAELRRETLSGSWCRVAFAPGRWTLAWSSGRQDITVVAEDGINLVQEQFPRPGDLGAQELAALWTDVASRDGRQAYRALGRLRASPRAAVALLKQELSPVPTRKEDVLARLIADLDSDRFPIRQQATRALEEIGEPAKPFLERSLSTKPTLEARRRLERLLSLLDAEGKEPSPQVLRTSRAVQLLEAIGSNEARALLQDLGRGAPSAHLTREAQAALKRLKRLAMK